MGFIQSFTKSLTNFVYPNICFHCENKIGENQSYLCLTCWSEIKMYSETADFTYLLDSKLKGKLNVEFTEALYIFQKNSPLQTLLHILKYDYKPHLGIYLGRLLGEKLRSEFKTESITGILPVPVHPLKKIERGYNQAEKIAEGVREILNYPELDATVIMKNHLSESQTKKNRIERWSSLTESFSLNFNSIWLKKQSHILIIDDVITTGATIESIGKLINEHYPKIKISVATIAATE